MQKFGGWLIKFGDVVLPNSFLLADGWESTPNHRETSPNFKTKLTLNIREMNLEERRAWNNIIGLAELPQTEKNQRRVRCTYWNDETLEYSSGIFYMSDTTYSIHTLSEQESDIDYNDFKVTLVEY